MATCHGEMHDLCIEVTTDSEDENVICIRETDSEVGTGPDVWVRTSRENWLKFVDEVKRGEHDDL